MEAKIAVVGMWHLGSVCAACLADVGHMVVGIDPDAVRIADLNQGKPPLYEPNLSELVLKNVSNRRLTFSTDPRNAANADFVIVALDTPIDEDDEVDLSPVDMAIRSLTPFLKDDCTIVISSQVPVGTCRRYAKMISQLNPRLRFGLAYVPENLRLGQAIERFMSPDMIVAGTDSLATGQRVLELFEFTDRPKKVVGLETAEMVKHGINSYLAMQISFINELADLCDFCGADASIVGDTMKLDSRVGQRALLKPGLGFAGGTLARDLKILRKLGRTYSQPTYIINSILRVNEERNGEVISRLVDRLGTLRGSTLVIFGLTYKPGTSTLRRSQAIEIINLLQPMGAKIRAHDPRADLKELVGSVSFKFYKDPYAASEGADALIFVVDWPEFHDLDFARLVKLVKRPIVFDAQNMFEPLALTELGFDYLGIGRGSKTGYARIP